MKRTWSQANAQEYGQLGIIESVKLRNFMCHDNLSFDLDPHMNFIVGRNGSGKSAVLTGIMLALGGKSGATGRFSNIKGFVKTGKNSASVSVTLKNCGPDAYKPDEYGEKITIERQLSSEGVSTYKLKSEAGRVISNSREELTNILSVMNIQIENPVTVLTQETSRNFLVSKNVRGDKLYKLFYEGTGLSKVHDDYNRALQQSEDAKSELQLKKAILPDTEKDLKTLKTLLDKCDRIDDLKKELLWAISIEVEAKRDEEVATFGKLQQEVSNLTRDLNLCEANIADIHQNEAAVETEKKASKERMVALRIDLEKLGSKRSTLKSEIREAQGTYSRHEREVKKVENEIACLETIMHELKMKNEHDIDEDKQKHEFALKNLRNEITKTVESVGKLENQKNALRETVEGMQKEVESYQAEIQEINYEKKRIMRDKQQLIDGMKNRLNVYGKEMEHVLRDIKAGVRAGIFKKEPKGPIGLSINVRKPEWNFAVQECLKVALLKTFLCDNHADADQLSKIFSKHYQRQRPSIIISTFVSEVYDVNNYGCKCQCQYPTLFDMLNIEDPVVANCLIDQKQIENIILIDDPAEACKVMLYSPPNKCSFAYSINGDQFCHSPFQKYSCRNKNQFCLLGSINEEDIRKKDNDIEILGINEVEKLVLQANLSKELELKNKEIEKLNDNIMNLNIKVKQLWMKLKNEENSYSEPKNINLLNTDLEELKKKKDYHEETLASYKEVVTSKTKELRSLDKQVEDCERTLQVESRSFSSLAEKREEHQNRKEKLNTSIHKIKSLLEQMKPVLKSKERVVKDHIVHAKVATDRAISVCSRIDTERSSDTIGHLLKEMQNQQQNDRDRESVVCEYKEKREKLRKDKEELNRQDKIIERLGRMMNQRFKEFQKIRKNASVSLTCAFTTLLKENNFIGYPDINFETKTLEIYARPEKSKSRIDSKSNLSQLSGGERSYVTIAFLLSVWDRMHTPFRILDEYDVFMDSNNRHLSIHLLINTARSNKKIQYIFLSPLELPPIEDSDHVKVHKMPDPRE